MKNKKSVFLVLFSVALLTLQGCDPIMFIPDLFAELFNPNLIIIRGEKPISGEGKTYTIPKGTTVRFKDTVFGSYGPQGSLIFSGGAKLIAQGTLEDPIVFESMDGTGIVTFETSASTSSIIEYCSLEDVGVVCKNTITIQYCKFNSNHGANVGIACNNNSNPIIQYNNFFFTNIYIDGDISNMPAPTIQYNNIDLDLWLNHSGTGIGICLYYGSSNTIIKFNNIINTYGYAIASSYYSSATINISSNYVSDCHGETGVDTDGSQCAGVVIDSFSTSPISGAGCGW